jgi:predicted phosphodiesterase
VENKKIKILSISDIHSRKVWRNIIEENIDKVDKIVIGGDYADPYEIISKNDILTEIYDLFDIYDEHKDKIILLWGNHDVHYLNENFIQSSRYDYSLKKELSMLYEEYENDIKVAYKYKNYLWTHGGISNSWLRKHINLMKNYFNLKDDLSNIDSVLNQIFFTTDKHILSEIGSIRGGFDTYGGPFWCDYREIYYPKENHDDMIEGFNQIIGHTQVKDITTYRRNENTSITIVDNLGFSANPHIIEI